VIMFPIFPPIFRAGVHYLRAGATYQSMVCERPEPITTQPLISKAIKYKLSFENPLLESI